MPASRHGHRNIKRPPSSASIPKLPIDNFSSPSSLLPSTSRSAILPSHNLRYEEHGQKASVDNAHDLVQHAFDRRVLRVQSVRGRECKCSYPEWLSARPAGQRGCSRPDDPRGGGEKHCLRASELSSALLTLTRPQTPQKPGKREKSNGAKRADGGRQMAYGCSVFRITSFIRKKHRIRGLQNVYKRMWKQTQRKTICLENVIDREHPLQGLSFSRSPPLAFGASFARIGSVQGCTLPRFCKNTEYSSACVQNQPPSMPMKKHRTQGVLCERKR